MAEAKTATTKTVKYGSLAEALVAFQKEIPVIVKDSRADTGKYGYEYASLPVLTPILFKALTDVGVAYVTAPDMVDGVFVLRAQLIHDSGETLGGNYPLGNPNAPAQAIGSAITYARRYALLALTGVSPEGSDDDGAAASTNTATQAAAAPAAPKAGSVAAIKEAMSAMINGSGGLIDGNDANALLKEISGSDNAADWTAAHFKTAQARLSDRLEQRKNAQS